MKQRKSGSRITTRKADDGSGVNLIGGQGMSPITDEQWSHIINTVREESEYQWSGSPHMRRITFERARG